MGRTPKDLEIINYEVMACRINTNIQGIPIKKNELVLRDANKNTMVFSYSRNESPKSFHIGFVMSNPLYKHTPTLRKPYKNELFVVRKYWGRFV